MLALDAFGVMNTTVKSSPSLKGSVRPVGTLLIRHLPAKQTFQRVVTRRTYAPERNSSPDPANAPTQQLVSVRQRLNEQLQRSKVAYLEGAEPLAAGPAPPSSAAGEYQLSMGWRPMPHHLSKEQLWEKIRMEARADADSEPSLASFLYSSILTHTSLEKALAFILANKLSNSTLLGTQLLRLIQDLYTEEPDLIDACCADLQAVHDRDPACDHYTQCLLYFKGFQAVQSHRVAHWLWKKGRKALSYALQSRVSEAFHVDIHPAARFGRGILMDHATGIVIGETAVVGDNVSMLHHVTLGGSGTGRGRRHPQLGHGVLLGAGVTVLGPVTVGAGTKIGAGSVVVNDLPEHCVAVGVPAKVIKRSIQTEPCKDMDQCMDFIVDYVI